MCKVAQFRTFFAPAVRSTQQKRGAFHPLPDSEIYTTEYKGKMETIETPKTKSLYDPYFFTISLVEPDLKLSASNGSFYYSLWSDLNPVAFLGLIELPFRHSFVECLAKLRLGKAGRRRLVPLHSVGR